MSNGFKPAPVSRHARTLLLVGFLAVLISACAELRVLTYPTSFTWIEQDEVKSTMQLMGQSMTTLDRLVAEEKKPGSNSAEILSELEDIEYFAASLSIRTPANDSNLPATNHLLIDEHMEEFLESILRSRMQVEQTPANYYGVGQLTGSCMACHRFR